MKNIRIISVSIIVVVTVCFLHGQLQPLSAQETSTKLFEDNNLYPNTLDEAPDIHSPATTDDGAEIILAFTKDKTFTLVPVTVANDGEMFDSVTRKYWKGKQLEVDETDFPTLAETGVHSEQELDNTETITGRPVGELTEAGRPNKISGAGFMADDEDIISVLKGDNRIVKKLGLTHPQMAKPLFHVWNMYLVEIDLKRFSQIEYIVYNDKKVSLQGQGSRGFQESLFDDEILGSYSIDILCELSETELNYLKNNYARLTEDQMQEMIQHLTLMHTGEMEPYFIMRYGFYEGHTAYRVDPVAIAFIFGLRSLEDIEIAFPGKLYETLTEHFTQKNQ